MKKFYLFSVLILMFSIAGIANAQMYTQSLNIGGSQDDNYQGASQTFTYSQLPSSNVIPATVQEVVPQNVTINNQYYYPAVSPYYGRTYINTVPYYSRTYPTYTGYMTNNGISVGYNAMNYNHNISTGGYTFKGGYTFGGGTPVYVNRPTYNPMPPVPPPNNRMIPPPNNHSRVIPVVQPGRGSAGYRLDW